MTDDNSECGTLVTPEYLTKFLTLYDRFHEEYFGTDSRSRYELYELDEKAYLSVNDSDFFSWGYAGQMPIDDLDMLREAYIDCEKIHWFYGVQYAPYLYLCRKLKLQPQGACLPHHREFRKLFEAVKVEEGKRSADTRPGNPYPTPEAYQENMGYEPKSKDYFGLTPDMQAVESREEFRARISTTDDEKEESYRMNRDSTPEERQLLRSAADLIEKKGHCKDTVVDHEGRHCLIGAMCEVVEESGGMYTIAYSMLSDYLGGRDLIHWNNEKERTAEEVIDTLRVVAALHEPRGEPTCRRQVEPRHA